MLFQIVRNDAVNYFRSISEDLAVTLKSIGL